MEEKWSLPAHRLIKETASLFLKVDKKNKFSFHVLGGFMTQQVKLIAFFSLTDLVPTTERRQWEQNKTSLWKNYSFTPGGLAEAVETCLWVKWSRFSLPSK